MQLGASVLVMGLQDAAAAARAESAVTVAECSPVDAGARWAAVTVDAGARWAAVTVALSDGAESERETKAEEWARERTLDAVEEREP